MARIYVNCGDYGKAINELDYLLSLEAEETVNNLKVWHWVDPLRDHPRYQSLIKTYALAPIP